MNRGTPSDSRRTSAASDGDKGQQHVGGLEHGVTDLLDGQLLVVGLLSGDDWSIRGKHEMDSWVWHQIGLELIQINV